MPLAALLARHVAVVTGGASGIGLAAASASLGMGLRVASPTSAASGWPRPPQAVAALPQAGPPTCWRSPTDVEPTRDIAPAASRRCWSASAAPHVLMNNAGIQPGSGMFGPEENWERVLGVNLWGVIHGTQVFAPGMIERGRARPDHQHRLEAGHHHAAGRSRPTTSPRPA